MGQSIIRLIARVFWVRADSGLARVSATSTYFNPLRGETIYYIVSCLNWGLKEYESGAKRTHRCGAGLESKKAEPVPITPCLDLADKFYSTACY